MNGTQMLSLAAALMLAAPPGEDPGAKDPKRGLSEQEFQEIDAKVKVELERVRQELERVEAEQPRVQEEIARALKELERVNLEDIRDKVKAEVERALAQLDEQEPRIRKQVEMALARAREGLERVREEAEEARETREQRAKFADSKWSAGATKGSETDRGRIYVRHGPPDEIESYPGKGEAWRYKNWRGTGGYLTFEFDAEGRMKQ